MRTTSLSTFRDQIAIIRNLKSTTECFDVKSEDISKNEIKFICETDSIVEFVKELCSNERIF